MHNNYTHQPRSKLDLTAIIDCVEADVAHVNAAAFAALRVLVAWLQRRHSIDFLELELYAAQGDAMRRAVNAAGDSGWLWIEPGVPDFSSSKAVPRWNVILRPFVGAYFRDNLHPTECDHVFGKGKTFMGT